MKHLFETNKLFYGSPVVIIGYKDDRFDYNMTTISANYSVANTVTMAMYTGNYSLTEIKKTNQFTVNVPTSSLLSTIELFGFNRGKDKLRQSQLQWSLGKYVDAPILKDCFIALECDVMTMVEVDQYTHIIADIKARWVDDRYFKDEHVDIRLMDTVHVFGDSYSRSYKFLTKESMPVGNHKIYLKGEKKDEQLSKISKRVTDCRNKTTFIKKTDS